MPISKEKFETSDTPMFALLRTLGYKMESSRKMKGKTYFLFPDKKQCEKLQTSYENGELVVEPLTFINHYLAGIKIVHR